MAQPLVLCAWTFATATTSTRPTVDSVRRRGIQSRVKNWRELGMTLVAFRFRSIRGRFRGGISPDIEDGIETARFAEEPVCLRRLRLFIVLTVSLESGLLR